jgi:hypothetical protein
VKTQVKGQGSFSGVLLTSTHRSLMEHGWIFRLAKIYSFNFAYYFLNRWRKEWGEWKKDIKLLDVRSVTSGK